MNGYNVRFTPETKRKVIEAAKALDYRPNIAARGLRAKKTFLLGLQFNAVNYPLIAGFTCGFQSVCTAESYAPIFLTHSEASEEADNVRTLIDRRVDGIVVNCAIDPDGGSNAAKFAEMRSSGVCLIEVFGRFVEGAPRVTLDYHAGAVAATRLLIEKGHQRIALFTHEDYRATERVPGLYWTAWEHWRGYSETMRAAGLEEISFTYPVGQDRTREGAHYFGAYNSMGRFFAHEKRPTAVVCYRGEAAEATVHYANANRSDSPDGFAIAVFDAVRPIVAEAIEVNVLPLPTEQVGSAAARMLLDLIAGKAVHDIAMGPPLAVTS